MSNKKLLNENTVRKFMKFANIGHLAEDFVKESDLYEDDEEELEFSPPTDEVAPDAAEDVGEFGAEMDAEMDAEVGLEDETSALSAITP